jgi:hypothetical protein
VPAVHCPTVEEFTAIPCERLLPTHNGQPVRWYVLRGTARPIATDPALEVVTTDSGKSANDEPERDARA